MKTHLFTFKKSKRPLRTVIQLLIIVVFAVVVLNWFIKMPEVASNENLALTERAIRSSVVNCYAIEGFYPQSVEYLEEHYGLLIDHKKYDVFYELLDGSLYNMPGIKVTAK